MVRYQDWTGERKQKCKRGFATKREAQEWERSFQMQTSGDLDMTFEAFTELYTKDVKPRLKENTWLTKENIIQKKILPYFGKRKISEITTKDVIAWQNELLAYRDEKRKPYSATYLKTLHNQLSAIRKQQFCCVHELFYAAVRSFIQFFLPVINSGYSIFVYLPDYSFAPATDIKNRTVQFFFDFYSHIHPHK